MRRPITVQLLHEASESSPTLFAIAAKSFGLPPKQFKARLEAGGVAATPLLDNLSRHIKRYFQEG